MQLHKALREFANQAFEQIDMLRGAFIDDDFAHFAIVQYVADIVITRQQRLSAEVEFSIDLNGLRRIFLVLQNAQASVKSEACELERLLA
jgi:hypothetical protein